MYLKKYPFLMYFCLSFTLQSVIWIEVLKRAAEFEEIVTRNISQLLGVHEEELSTDELMQIEGQPFAMNLHLSYRIKRKK